MLERKKKIVKNLCILLKELEPDAKTNQQTLKIFQARDYHKQICALSKLSWHELGNEMEKPNLMKEINQEATV